MKARAIRSFKHEGKDYATGAEVKLGDDALTALARSGLVEITEPSKPAEPPKAEKADTPKEPPKDDGKKGK